DDEVVSVAARHPLGGGLDRRPDRDAVRRSAHYLADGHVEIQAIAQRDAAQRASLLVEDRSGADAERPQDGGRLGLEKIGAYAEQLLVHDVFDCTGHALPQRKGRARPFPSIEPGGCVALPMRAYAPRDAPDIQGVQQHRAAEDERVTAEDRDQSDRSERGSDEGEEAEPHRGSTRDGDRQYARELPPQAKRREQLEEAGRERPDPDDHDDDVHRHPGPEEYREAHPDAREALEQDHAG